MFLPNHSQALNAECSHLSFGTYKVGNDSASSEAFTPINLSRDGLEINLGLTTLEEHLAIKIMASIQPLGTDSHICTAGAFGQFATGIGNIDAGFVLEAGKLLLKMPPTLRFVLDGGMPSYLFEKDLILQIIGEILVAGATYKSMEFVGNRSKV